MDKYNGKSFGDAMPSFDYVYSGQKERDNQPIEEKWKIDLASHKLESDEGTVIPLYVAEDFIENLLEQERKRMSDEGGKTIESYKVKEEPPCEQNVLLNLIKGRVLAIINK